MEDASFVILHILACCQKLLEYYFLVETWYFYVSAICYKEVRFWDFMFAFLHNKLQVKRDLLWQERICPQIEQILSFKNWFVSGREAKAVLTDAAAHENVQ